MSPWPGRWEAGDVERVSTAVAIEIWYISNAPSSGCDGVRIRPSKRLLAIGASILRLGFVANFISTPVLTGFKAGIGMVIVLDQVPNLLGIHITKEGFFRDMLSVAHHVPETSLITLTIAVVALLALLAMERMRPHPPAPLVVVGAGIAASWLFGLSALGVGRWG
jgi:sulfate permease, SulP family